MGTTWLPQTIWMYHGIYFCPVHMQVIHMSTCNVIMLTCNMWSVYGLSTIYRAKRTWWSYCTCIIFQRKRGYVLYTIVLIEYSRERNFFFIILSCPAIRILKVHMGRINYLQNARVNQGRERWYPPPPILIFFLIYVFLFNFYYT